MEACCVMGAVPLLSMESGGNVPTAPSSTSVLPVTMETDTASGIPSTALPRPLLQSMLHMVVS